MNGRTKPKIVNVEQLAEFLNLTKRRVQQLRAGGLPRELRGKYDLHKCARFYIRYLQTVLERTATALEPGAAATERQAKVQLLRANAALRELELSRTRSQLVAVADVEKEVRKLSATATAHMLSVAPRLAPEILGETSRVMVQAKLEKALKDALSQLARRAD